MRVTPFEQITRQIVDIGREFHSRGWVMATSGNFSAVLGREPLRLAITVSGVDKGALTLADVIEIDDSMAIVASTPLQKEQASPTEVGSRRGKRPTQRAAAARVESISRHGATKPSDESRLHIFLTRAAGAGAVLHTHSVWSAVLSRADFDQGGVALEGFEMLKALEGVTTHEHREWLPILANTQDMSDLARRAGEALEDLPGIHGFLVAGHGLYTWGSTLAHAKRHTEALEFLLETQVRLRASTR